MWKLCFYLGRSPDWLLTCSWFIIALVDPLEQQLDDGGIVLGEVDSVLNGFLQLC